MKYHLFTSGHFGAEHKTCHSRQELSEVLAETKEGDIIGIVKGGNDWEPPMNTKYAEEDYD